jgi:adenine/guanine phosphoribosyltransferase-like PRPP-binding protein
MGIPPSSRPRRASSSAVASMVAASWGSRAWWVVTTSVCSNVVTRSTFPVDIGSQCVDLPLVPLSSELTLALLITVDMGVEFMRRAGEELAAVLAPFEVDIVATVATMGIPVAIEVTRALGLDQYVILHKTPKIHLADAVSERVRSITTDVEQRLLFDRARIPDVAGRRVAIVDDVISTGASTGTALRLLRSVDANVVAIGTLVTEASLWRTSLDGDANMVHALGAIPIFRPDDEGGLREDWAG